jgi:hypothetical protein
MPCCALCARFIKNNLLLELTSNKAKSAFAWLLKKHTFMSYSLYMAGAQGGQQQQQAAVGGQQQVAASTDSSSELGRPQQHGLLQFCRKQH